jgi:hypothetical protein
MSESNPNNESVSDELKKLGVNIKSVLNAFWESEERKSATRQLEHGAAEVAKAFDQLADDVTNSETSRKLQSEMNDIQNRFRSGELETKVREDVVTTLNKINKELAEFTQRWSTSSEATADPENPSTRATEEETQDVKKDS